MTKLITKSALIISLATAMALSSALTAFGASVVLLGNDTTARTQVDTASSFAIVDTNHPAMAAGQITSLGYYASNLNPFNLILVDGAGVVKWVSPQITPLATGEGTFTPTAPVPIQMGWNLGVYFPLTGAIPFEFTGATASWTLFGSALPTVGSTLAFDGSSARTYSFVGNGDVAVPALTSATLSPATAAIKVGGTQQLTAGALDQNGAALAGATFAYVSATPEVATVSALGLVTGVSPGTAVITVTATSGTVNVTATASITVSAKGGEGGGEGGGAIEQENENEGSGSSMGHEDEHSSSTAVHTAPQEGHSNSHGHAED